MNILSRIMAIASLFFVLTIGMQVYPMDPAAQYRVMHYEGTQIFAAVAEVPGKSGRLKEKQIGHLSYLWEDGDTAYINTLMVLPEYQKCGIGGTLLDAAIDYFRAQDQCAVSLHAHPLVAEGTPRDQVVGARERLYVFYGKRGFKSIEEGYGEMVLQLRTPAFDEYESMSMSSQSIHASDMSDSQE